MGKYDIEHDNETNSSNMHYFSRKIGVAMYSSLRLALTIKKRNKIVLSPVGIFSSEDVLAS